MIKGEKMNKISEACKDSKILMKIPRNDYVRDFDKEVEDTVDYILSRTDDFKKESEIRVPIGFRSRIVYNTYSNEHYVKRIYILPDVAEKVKELFTNAGYNCYIGKHPYTDDEESEIPWCSSSGRKYNLVITKYPVNLEEWEKEE